MTRRTTRIARRFRELRARHEAALIPFIVAGDPDLDHTRLVALELEAQGADLIEIGVPFSDPMADGPANQRALARGLTAGATLPAILNLVAELRRVSEIPIILFGYFNPFYRYGCGRFCADASRAGVDGVLAVDLPPEESAELDRPARACGLDVIRLLAPTTPPDRSARIARSASGFLYYVSVAGVTGARAALPADLGEHVRALRSLTSLPVGVGFGIATAAQAAEVARFADAVVAGSVFSLLIEEHGKTPEAARAVGGLARAMKDAMRAARTAGGERAAEAKANG
jgi:tryptophan synthase alpha chain